MTRVVAGAGAIAVAGVVLKARDVQESEVMEEQIVGEEVTEVVLRVVLATEVTAVGTIGVAAEVKIMIEAATGVVSHTNVKATGATAVTGHASAGEKVDLQELRKVPEENLQEVDPQCSGKSHKGEGLPKVDLQGFKKVRETEDLQGVDLQCNGKYHKGEGLPKVDLQGFKRVRVRDLQGVDLQCNGKYHKGEDLPKVDLQGFKKVRGGEDLRGVDLQCNGKYHKGEGLPKVDLQGFKKARGREVGLQILIKALIRVDLPRRGSFQHLKEKALITTRNLLLRGQLRFN